MHAMEVALIKKDIHGIRASKQLLIGMISVPIALTIVVPTIFILLLHFMPDLNDFDAMLKLLPVGVQEENMENAILSLLINNIMPVFFIIIPIMAASIMAASAFVGEKEKRTLETLLYCPLSLNEIFRAKVLSAFIVSELVSLGSFVMMTLVTQIEIFLTRGSLLLPNMSWIVVLLLLSPAVSLIAITVIVRGSAKAQTMEESQQRSGLLILPVIFLLAGQFTGIVLINIWILLGLSIFLAVIAWILMNSAFRKMTYESILH